MITLNLDPTWHPLETSWSELDIKQFVFSGGEVHIKLMQELTKDPYINFDEILIKHRINNSQNLMELMMAADAVRRLFPDIPISAEIPYLPYARQDRSMVEGEPFSLQVFADILATAKFKNVYTLDPHSDVAAAVIRNLIVEPSDYLKKAYRDILEKFIVPETFRAIITAQAAAHFEKDLILCAPDGGALKKIYKQAKMIGYNGPIICGGKVRNLNDGKILRTTLDTMGEDITGKTVWIIDDICDGGRTFIELAQVLRERGAERVVLSVSHGIFSQGEGELKKHLDKIYTTDSVKNDESDLIKRYHI